MSQERNFSVVVVGSTMIDLISYLPRVPEVGETVVGDSFQMTFGGKGANQAIMAATLGSNVGFINCLGQDTYGEEYRRNLEQYDIDISFLTVGELPTGVATILVEENGANRIVIVPGANFELAPEIAEQGILSLRPSVVVGQLEISTQATIAAFKAGKEIGATTVLNPAPATDDSALPSELLELTDWLIPNENEFHALANEEVSEDAVWSFARKHKIKLVVTVGEEGAILADTEGEIIRFAAPTVTAVDTTGAGDAFVGAFAHGLSTGLNPKDAISLAIDRASDSVTRKGTQISYSSDGA